GIILAPVPVTMKQERRNGLRERRRTPDRRQGDADRRAGGTGGPMGDRRTRFSIFYFLLAFLLLIGLNYMLGQQDTARISYSELKARIAAGQIEEVSVGDEVLRATVADSVRTPGTPEVLTAVRVPED